MADRCDLLCLDLPKAERLRGLVPSSDEAAVPAGNARALADPLRVRLAVALAEGDELCVCDLAWIVGRSDQLVSHHLRQLRAGGLVDSRRDGKMVLYRLTAGGEALLHALRALPAVGVVP